MGGTFWGSKKVVKVPEIKLVTKGKVCEKRLVEVEATCQGMGLQASHPDRLRPIQSPFLVRARWDQLHHLNPKVIY